MSIISYETCTPGDVLVANVADTRKGNLRLKIHLVYMYSTMRVYTTSSLSTPSNQNG